MKQRTIDNITAFLAGLALFFACFLSFEAMAGGYDRDDMQQEQKQYQDQTAKGGDAHSDAHSDATGGTATASNDGVTVEGDSVENNSSNVVLVPNNNTESCVRVFGLAFGKNGESGAIGWPWRSRACDFEQAADDAFAAGERNLGWFWKCQNKNVARPFKLEGMSWDDAKMKCHEMARGAQQHSQLVEELQRQVETANKRAAAAENLAELSKRHEVVCDESLMKCEKKLYGGK